MTVFSTINQPTTIDESSPLEIRISKELLTKIKLSQHPCELKKQRKTPPLPKSPPPDTTWVKLIA